MDAEHTLLNIKQHCLSSSGDEQIWTNKGTTYHWNRGRDTSTGLVNGVVRKLVGLDPAGKQIWVVAGSFKINEYGTILRFTGLPKKLQQTFEPVRRLHVTNTDNPIDFPQVEVV